MRIKPVSVTDDKVIISVEQYEIVFVKKDGKIVKTSHIDWNGSGTRPPNPFFAAAISMAAAIFRDREKRSTRT